MYDKMMVVKIRANYSWIGDLKFTRNILKGFD